MWWSVGWFPYVAIHRNSSHFIEILDPLSIRIITIYEDKREKVSLFVLIRRNSLQFVVTDPSESKNFAFCDERGRIPMNCDSRYSYNLTIAVMDI